MLEEVKFSVSRFNLQTDCLQKYYYKYVVRDKRPEVTWASTILGLAYHQMFEDMFGKDPAQVHALQKKKNISKKHFQEFFGKTIFDYFEEEDKLATSQGKIIKINRKFDSKYFEQNADEWALTMFRFLLHYIKDFVQAFPELQFDFDLEFPEFNKVLKINGFIDLTAVYANDKVKLFDYKNTTSPQTYYVLNQIDIQSKIYLFVYSHLFGVVPENFSYIVSDLFSKMIFIKEVESKNIVEDGTKILKAFLIRHELSKKQTNFAVNQVTCKYCEYKSICPKTKSEKK